MIPISVMQIVEEKLKDYCRFTLFTSNLGPESGMTVIAAIDQENTQTGLIDVLGDICKETRKILEVPITIGIGHRCTDLVHISDSYKAAVDALATRPSWASAAPSTSTTWSRGTGASWHLTAGTRPI